MTESTESTCAGIAAAIKIIGDKWSGFLIGQLIEGPRRFSALQEALAGISPRTLSQRLDLLEAEGIITKTVFAQSPPRVEYALTAKGKDLSPILESMVEWSAKHPVSS